MPYTETVTVSGTVEEEKKKEISLDLPIVPEQVMVQVGEKVEAGDVLATIDVKPPKTLLPNLPPSTLMRFRWSCRRYRKF